MVNNEFVLDMKGINMNLVKITLSVAVVALLVGFNVEVSAARTVTDAGATMVRQPPAHLVNDTQEGSAERELYETLRGKGIDIMQDGKLSPRGIKSLTKYLRYLLNENAELLNDVRRDDPGTIGRNIWLAARRATLQYHEQATAKQAGARSMIETSTLCLDTICAAIRVVTSDASHGSTDRAHFDTAFAQMMNAYRGDTGLMKQLNDHWEGKSRKVGGTADAVYKHADALRRTIEAIVALSAGVIANNVDRKDKKDECERAMQMFHEAYSQFAEIGGGEWIYQFANNNYPGFVAYYKAWIPQNPDEGRRREPVIGLPRENW